MSTTDAVPDEAGWTGLQPEVVADSDRLRQFLAGLPVIAWSAGADGALVFLNRRWYEVTGLEEIGGLGWNWISAIHPDDRAPSRDAWQQALTGGEGYEVEHRLRTRAGDWRWYLSRAVPLHGPSGAIEQWAGTSTDIDAQKRAEVVQRERQDFTRRVLDNLLTFAGVLDPDGTLLEANQAPLRAVGLTLEDVRGKKFWDCYWWSHSPMVQEQLRAACALAAEGEVVRYDTEVRFAGDQRAILDFQIAPLRDEKGRVTHLIPSALDISDRKQAEYARQESQARFRLMADTAPAMLWVTDATHGCTLLSRAWSDYTGQPEAAGLGFGWLAQVHPDDQERSRRIFLEAAEERRSFSIDCRMRRADDTYRWVIDAGRPRFSESGRFLGYVGSVIDVHDRKEAEQRLRESETRFRKAADAVNGIIFEYDLATGHVERSRGLYEVLGYRQGEVPATVDWWRAQIHPDDRETIEPAVERAAAGGDGVVNEYRVRHKDGHWVYVWEQSLLVRNREGEPRKLIGTTIDITARKALEDTLRESEARFRVMADNLPLMVWLHDAAGKQEFVNQTFCDYFGVTREEMREERWQLLTHADDGPAYAMEFARCVREQQPFHAEVRVQRGDGQWRWVESWGQPYYSDDGEFRGFVGSSADVTERKEATLQLRQLNEQLEQRVTVRTAELEEQNRRLRRLAAQVTEAEQRERRQLAETLHDGLQQILIAAKVQLSMWLEDEVVQSVERLDALLDTAIQTSRSLSYELSPPVLHTSALPDALAWLARRFEADHNLDVRLEVASGFPRLPEHMKVFLFNAVRELLLNVVKHAGETPAHVVLATAEPRRVHITVADEGRGFDPDELEIGNGELGGFGLFSIQERLAALGGEFQVEARPGGGARFHLTVALPEATPAPTEESLPPQAVAAVAPAPGRTIRLLLADDHAILRQGLISLLQREPDIECVGEARDGLEAVARAAELQPDVILMDVNMPGQNGISATHEIKRAHPETIVIGLSFHEEEEMAAAMRDAGAAAYFRKGGDTQALLETIRELYHA